MAFNFGTPQPPQQPQGQRKGAGFSFADWARQARTYAPGQPQAQPTQAQVPQMPAQAPQQPTQEELDFYGEMMRQGRSQGWDGSWNPPHVLSLAGNTGQQPSMSATAFDWSDLGDEVEDAPVVQPAGPAPDPRAGVAFADPAPQPQGQVTIETPQQAEERRPNAMLQTPDAPQDNRGVSSDWSDYTVENDPRRLAIGQKLAVMIANGTPDDEIRQFMAQSGITDPSNIEAVLAYRKTPDYALWKQQNPNKPYPLSEVFDDVYVPLTTGGKALARLAGSQLGAGLIGASEGASLSLVDEAAGAINATRDTLRNGGSWSDNYDRNVADFRAGQDAVQAANPGTYFIGEAAGSLATGLGVSKGLSLIPRVGAMAAPAAYAVEGATIGAIQGFGDGRGLKDSLVGAATGAATGAAIGYGAGRVTDRIAATNTRGETGQQLIDDAAHLEQSLGQTPQQALKPLPGMVGGNGTKMAQGISESTMFGGQRIATKYDEFAANADKTLDQIAGVNGGGRLTPEEAARVIGRPGDTTNFAALPARLDQRLERLYTTARNLAQDAPIYARKTIAVLDGEIARLQARPGKTANLDDLIAFRDNLKKSSYPLTAMRSERTDVGRLLDVKDGAQRSLAKRIWGSITEDIHDNLAAQGLDDASRAFTRADKAYANSIVHKKRVDDLLAGGDEEIAKRLMSMGATDGQRLQRNLRLMDPKGAKAVRQSVISRLGRDSNEGDFSVSTFLTNYKKLKSYGREALFPGEHGKDIEAFARLMKAAQKSGRFRNNSQTARYVNLRQSLGTVASLGGGAATGAMAGGGLAGGAVAMWMTTTAGSFALSRIITSPLAAKALVRWAKNGTPIERATRWLTIFAERNPDFAEEAQALIEASREPSEAERMAPNIADPLASQAPIDAPVEDWSDLADEVVEPEAQPQPTIITGQDGMTIDPATGAYVDISGLTR